MTERMTQADYARHRNCKPSYISRLVKENKIPFEQDGKKKWIIPAQADAVLDAQSDPARQLTQPETIPSLSHPTQEAPSGVGGDDLFDQDNATNSAAETSGQPQSTFNQVRTEREKWQVLQAKLDYEKAAGDLVETKAVKSAGFELGQIFKDKLMAMIPQMRGEMCGITNEHEMTQFLKQRFNAFLLEVQEDVSGRVQNLS